MKNIIQGDSSNFWFLIFHLNISGNFFTKDEVLNCNKKHKFSVLGKINDLYKTADGFEFLLTYPQTDGYIHWTQQENPLSRTTRSELNTINDTFQSKHQFEGLSYLDSDFTFLEGQITSGDWFYAIGQYRGGNGYPNSLAGPYWELNGEIVHEVNLYIKIYDISIARKLYQFSTFSKHTLHYHIHLFLIYFFIDLTTH